MLLDLIPGLFLNIQYQVSNIRHRLDKIDGLIFTPHEELNRFMKHIGNIGV